MTSARGLAAEFVGTALLLAIVVGSGIMGERLAAGNQAVALLANTLATGAGLFVLIVTFAPVSGAHFNPAVSVTSWWHGQLSGRSTLGFCAAQVIGAIAGVWLAHAMFAEPLLQVSGKAREGLAQGLSEAVATFGLIGIILASQRSRPAETAAAVGLYISSAYWFTASTSFANPAVTLARTLTDSFAGIALASVPTFLAGQALGTLAAVLFFGWLLKPEAQA